MNTNELWEKNLYSFYREIPINRLLSANARVEMIEVLSTSLIETKHYRRITSEFEEMWRRLDRHRYEIDVVLGNGRLFTGLNAFSRKVSQLKNLPAQSKFEAFWKLFCRFYRKKSKKFTSDILLQSNRLWSIRYWEYPWTITNSRLTKRMKILDVGSGWSLFPMYLAKHGHHVDATDTNKEQMTKISPFLARIQKVEINYRVQNVTQLDYAGDTFDRVFCISTLEHIEEEIVNGQHVNYHSRNLDIIAISEMLRVLRPGGLLVITVDYGENPSDKRSYRLRDIYKRLLYPYQHLLLNNDKPAINWHKHCSEIIRLWENKFPFLKHGVGRSSIGIILEKK